MSFKETSSTGCFLVRGARFLTTAGSGSATSFLDFLETFSVDFFVLFFGSCDSLLSTFLTFLALGFFGASESAFDFGFRGAFGGSGSNIRSGRSNLKI